MKKFLTGVVVAGMMTTGVAFAAEVYGTAGCGLGSMVLGDQPGIVQIFAATTNGTSGSQTFGITSGTSNCEKQAKFSSNKTLNEFVLANIDNLSKDISKGYGESLDTMAELMNIPVVKRTEVYGKLQANFSSIFTSAIVEAPEVVDNIVTIIQ